MQDLKRAEDQQKQDNQKSVVDEIGISTSCTWNFNKVTLEHMNIRP